MNEINVNIYLYGILFKYLTLSNRSFMSTMRRNGKYKNQNMLKLIFYISVEDRDENSGIEMFLRMKSFVDFILNTFAFVFTAETPTSGRKMKEKKSKSIIKFENKFLVWRKVNVNVEKIHFNLFISRLS